MSASGWPFITGPEHHGHPGHQAIGHRHIDVAPQTRAGAFVQCRDGAQGSKHARGQIADREIVGLGGIAGSGALEHQSGDRLIGDVVRRPVLVGPGLPEAGDRHVDQPRIDRLRLLVAKAQARHRAGPEAFEQHVGLGDQRAQPLAAFVGLQIERDGSLVAVQRRMEGRELARRITAGRPFDQDHLGPQIGHQQRRIRARILLGQADDPNAGQRAGRLCLRLARHLARRPSRRRVQRPFHTGVLFSTKAEMPSTASSAIMLRTTSSDAYS
jgi:hypothetical protein